MHQVKVPRADLNNIHQRPERLLHKSPVLLGLDLSKKGCYFEELDSSQENYQTGLSLPKKDGSPGRSYKERNHWEVTNW